MLKKNSTELLIKPNDATPKTEPLIAETVNA
jgi:hypothetical protein